MSRGDRDGATDGSVRFDGLVSASSAGGGAGVGVDGVDGVDGVWWSLVGV